MHPTPIITSSSLGIHLDSDTFAPGDTVTGYVYRALPLSTSDASVSCCLHGGASVESNNDAGINSKFALLTCHQKPNILHRGPLFIRSGDSEQWHFSMEIPIYADSTANAGNTFASYTPVGVTDHQLPPTYALHSPGVISLCVEYLVSARLVVFLETGNTTVIDAVHPFKLVQYSPNSPIADFATRVWRYPRSTKSMLLIPGIQEERRSLFSWNKRSLLSAAIFTR